MKKEIKLIKRKPTFEYILNDLAFESLKLKVIHGVATNQEKFDFDYQLKLKGKEIEHLQSLVNKTTNYYLKTLAKNGSMPDEAVEMFNLLEGNK